MQPGYQVVAAAGGSAMTMAGNTGSVPTVGAEVMTADGDKLGKV